MKRFSSILDSKTSNLPESGFTLLEILIAITILAFITLGVVNITENAALTMQRTTEANTNNLQIETAMSRFEWDFSQIYSPLYFSTVMNLNQNLNPGGNPGETPENQTQPPPAPISPQLRQYYEVLSTRFERNEHFKALSREGYPIPKFYSPEKDTFEFFTTSNRRKLENLKQSHFAWVRYGLSSQDPTPTEEENPKIPKSLKSLVRYFSPDDPYSDKRIDVDATKGAVLLRNVEKLEFQFWDEKRKKWETSLRSTPDGESLLRGVRILLTWYDSTGSKRSTSRTFRTHWPMVTPKDQPTPNRPATTTPQGGANGGQGENEN